MVHTQKEWAGGGGKTFLSSQCRSRGRVGKGHKRNGAIFRKPLSTLELTGLQVLKVRIRWVIVYV